LGSIMSFEVPAASHDEIDPALPGRYSNWERIDLLGGDRSEQLWEEIDRQVDEKCRNEDQQRRA
jgi:hypothetical protein